MAAASWRSVVHALVVDRGRVLLVPSGGGWALPSVELDGDAEQDLRETVRALEVQLRAPVTILRYADRMVHRDRRLLELVYVLELPGSVATPAGARWAVRHELSQVALAEPGHAELIDRELLAGVEPRAPAQRAPWAHAGWLDDAEAWIRASLAGLGRPGSGRIEQVRVWCLSSLLRVPTADGAVFFKATAASPLFADEGSVMRGLAQLFPGNVPAPLAVDSVRRWMLLDDLGPELGWDAPLEVREDVLRVFAGMQIASAGRVQELLELGCVDRRLDVLAAEGRDLLADDAALAGLDDEEAARARAFGSRLDELCAALAESGLPDTLLHGDLHLSNVAHVDGRYVLYDWTDASVGNPLFDLIDVFREETEQVHDQLRDVYLSSWVDTEPIDRLRDLWTQAQPLAFLHHAVSYRHIAASVEPGAGGELEWALPYFLRKMLEAETRAG